jgi:predicted membrane protein
MRDKNRLIFGFLILFVGIIFLLGQFGVLALIGLSSWFVVSLIWPAALIYWGYRVFFKSNSFWGVILMIFGSLTLLDRFVNVSFWNILWPLVIISLGIWILFRKEREVEFGVNRSESSEDSIYEDVVFWGMDRIVKSKAFKGGEVNCIFGGGKLDLSKVKLAKDGAELEINCIFGGLELIVPEECRLISDGTGVFGGWNSKVKEGKKDSPTLKISGAAVFGGVNIKR